MSFDWRFYLRHNKDLVQNGIINEKSAITHYKNHGKKEGRLYNQSQLKSLKIKYTIKDYINAYTKNKQYIIDSVNSVDSADIENFDIVINAENKNTYIKILEF